MRLFHILGLLFVCCYTEIFGVHPFGHLLRLRDVSFYRLASGVVKEQASVIFFDDSVSLGRKSRLAFTAGLPLDDHRISWFYTASPCAATRVFPTFPV